jgi:type IV pilus assembly protein PilZ
MAAAADNRKDNREDERYPVNLPVNCSSHEVDAASHVANLSRGGLFIASEKPLPSDSLLELTLTLPDPPSEIRALGRVVWTCDIRTGTCLRAPGMGLRFLSMSHADWKRLIEFLAGLSEPAEMPSSVTARTATSPAEH